MTYLRTAKSLEIQIGQVTFLISWAASQYVEGDVGHFYTARDLRSLVSSRLYHRNIAGGVWWEEQKVRNSLSLSLRACVPRRLV